MISVNVNNAIQVEPLIESILAAFPNELKDNREKVNFVSQGAEKGEYVLQVNALVPRARIIELVRQQAARQKEASPAEVEQGQEEVAEACDVETQDLRAILDIAMKIPGAKNVINAALAVLGAVDDTIMEAGQGILSAVSQIEEKVRNLEKASEGNEDQFADVFEKIQECNKLITEKAKANENQIANVERLMKIATDNTADRFKSLETWKEGINNQLAALTKRVDMVFGIFNTVGEKSKEAEKEDDDDEKEKEKEKEKEEGDEKAEENTPEPFTAT